MFRLKQVVRLVVILVFVASLLALPAGAQDAQPVKIATGWGGAELAAFVYRCWMAPVLPTRFSACQVLRSILVRWLPVGMRPIWRKCRARA